MSALHNAWQFHKNDNYFYSRVKVAKELENLITDAQDQYRQELVPGLSLNPGLIKKILGGPPDPLHCRERFRFY